MKRNILIVVTIAISYCCHAQIDSRRGLEYLSEYVDTSMIYTDVFCNNINNLPVSAVGINRTEAAVHYSSSYYCGDLLYMISIYRNISAVQYTELFIYDDFQNLIEYVYLMDDVEMVYKFNPEVKGSITPIVEKNKENFEQNYFIPNPETFFDYSSIKERERIYLKKYANVFTCFLEVESEVLRIRELYKYTNDNKSLVSKIKGSYTLYYEGSKLVKVILKNERVNELYLDDGELYFAYISAWNDIPEIRIYCYNGVAFKIIYGKENIKMTDEKFCEYSSMIKTMFYEMTEEIKK